MKRIAALVAIGASFAYALPAYATTLCPPGAINLVALCNLSMQIMPEEQWRSAIITIAPYYRHYRFFILSYLGRYPLDHIRWTIRGQGPAGKKLPYQLLFWCWCWFISSRC